MVWQCDCGTPNPCPDDPPPPCDKLKDAAKACAERCPPCGESYDCLKDPCPPPPHLASDATAEAIDARSVQQGGVSQP